MRPDHIAEIGERLARVVWAAAGWGACELFQWVQTWPV